MNKEKSLSRRTDALLGSAGILPAIRGILPRTQRDGFAGTQVESFLSAGKRASGKMPDGASRMLALPDQQRTAAFRLRMLMILLCVFFPLVAFGQSDPEFAKANQDFAQG